MQACIFARRRLYLTKSIPKKILFFLVPPSSEVGHKGLWVTRLVYFILCGRLMLGNYFTFHAHRISKEWPLTEVKDWKGNAGVIYSISSSCSAARISWEMVVILLLKNLPAARMSELSSIGCSSA